MTSGKRYVKLMLLIGIAAMISPHAIQAQDRHSARISALGGKHVSGIIPDFYTDLFINPAYALFADSMTLSYGYRSAALPAWPYKYLDYNLDLENESGGTLHTNEFMAYGIGLGGWRLAAAADWRISEDEGSDSWLTDRYTSNYFEYVYHNDYSINNLEFWRTSLTAAHPLGGGSALGFRLGGKGYYRSNKHRFKYTTEQFNSSSLSKTDMDTRDRLDSNTERHVSGYAQAGLYLDRGGSGSSEIILSLSRDPVFSEHHTYTLYTSRGFSSLLEEIDEYSYDLDEWMERHDGISWTFSLTGRHSFRSGLKLFARGAFVTSTYETGWTEIFNYYSWDRGDESNMLNTLGLPGDGRSKNMLFIAKAGKTHCIRRSLNITAAIKCALERSWADEKADGRFDMFSEKEVVNEYRYISVPVPIDINYSETDAALIVPVAVEFEPCRYFSCFAGFYSRIVWRDRNERISFEIPFDPLSIESRSRRASVYASGQTEYFDYGDRSMSDSGEIFESDYTATFGFSLHYGERLFFDVCTGSDLTPDNVTSMIMDVRYRF